MISWWAHVTVAPDESDIGVFNEGISQGLEGLMLVGGQIEPISIAGDRLEWRKAREEAAKDITSVVVDGIIP
jgi:hypothetical protein